ncbi:transmembrane amino acid transporter protein-domain-containing protein [Melampsora americana]|nr:transmembrane amino acid transporter protein-domain-containing protein [Melampsora americana]
MASSSSRTEPSSTSTTTPLLNSASKSLHSSQLDSFNSNGTANLFSSIANISNTILGTGMLAMSHAFASSGLILGFLTVLISGLMSYFGLLLLSICATHQRIPHRRSSFNQISQITFPNLSFIFDLAISIKCFGVSISYLLIFGKLLPQVILGFHFTSIHDDSFVLDRRFWITISMFILVPLSFLRKLNSLRYTSYIALIAVLDLLFVVLYKFFDQSGLKQKGQIEWVRIDQGFLTVLPVYVFAYTCAQNIFSVHNELISNTRNRMNLVLRTSIGSAALIYEVIGTLGYLTFGDHVSSNLISDYHNSMMISICRLSISLLVLFSYPLQLHPCRNSIEKVLDQFKLKSDSIQVIEDEMNEEEMEGVEDHDDLIRFVIITTLLLLSSFFIAVNLDKLETVLSFVGSTGSTTISYILPGIFFLKLFDGKETDHSIVPIDRLKLMRLGAKALVLVGFLIMIVCLSLNVKEALK